LSIACVQWDLFDAGRQASWQDGPIKIYRLGYFWWDYNGYNGELQYIRFGKQMFFPPNAIVAGYSWQLEPGVRGDFNHTFTKLNELPVEVINQAVGLASGKVLGIGKVTNAGITSVPNEPIKVGHNQRLKGYISN